MPAREQNYGQVLLHICKNQTNRKVELEEKALVTGLAFTGSLLQENQIFFQHKEMNKHNSTYSLARK